MSAVPPAAPSGPSATALRPPPAVPYLGVLVGVPAVLAHAFALAGLLSGLGAYRSAPGAVVLFLASAALPATLVVCARAQTSRAPGPVLVGVVAGVLAVSAAVCADLPPDLRSSMQSWNWGTGAMTLLGLAAFVPTSRAIAAGLAHGAFAAGVQLAADGDAWRVLLVLVATLVPPLAAAGYLRSYAEALRRRAGAVDARASAETERAELDDVRLVEVRRLAGLREETEGLLARVAGGTPIPLGDADTALAADLAARLRATLTAERYTQWLPERVGTASVTVVCSPAAGRELTPGDRAWAAAVLEVLGAHPGWRSVRVVLDVAPRRRPRARRSGTAAAPVGGGVAVVVTAEGTSAAAAAGDARLRALARERSARLAAESEFLSVDTDLRGTMGA